MPKNTFRKNTFRKNNKRKKSKVNFKRTNKSKRTNKCKNKRKLIKGGADPVVSPVVAGLIGAAGITGLAYGVNKIRPRSSVSPGESDPHKRRNIFVKTIEKKSKSQISDQLNEGNVFDLQYTNAFATHIISISTASINAQLVSWLAAMNTSLTRFVVSEDTGSLDYKLNVDISDIEAKLNSMSLKKVKKIATEQGVDAGIISGDKNGIIDAILGDKDQIIDAALNIDTDQRRGAFGTSALPLAKQGLQQAVRERNRLGSLSSSSPPGAPVQSDLYTPEALQQARDASKIAVQGAITELEGVELTELGVADDKHTLAKHRAHRLANPRARWIALNNMIRFAKDIYFFEGNTTVIQGMYDKCKQILKKGRDDKTLWYRLSGEAGGEDHKYEFNSFIEKVVYIILYLAHNIVSLDVNVEYAELMSGEYEKSRIPIAMGDLLLAPGKYKGVPQLLDDLPYMEINVIKDNMVGIFNKEERRMELNMLKTSSESTVNVKVILDLFNYLKYGLYKPVDVHDATDVNFTVCAYLIRLNHFMVEDVRWTNTAEQYHSISDLVEWFEGGVNTGAYDPVGQLTYALEYNGGKTRWFERIPYLLETLAKHDYASAIDQAVILLVKLGGTEDRIYFEIEQIRLFYIVAKLKDGPSITLETQLDTLIKVIQLLYTTDKQSLFDTFEAELITLIGSVMKGVDMEEYTLTAIQRIKYPDERSGHFLNAIAKLRLVIYDEREAPSVRTNNSKYIFTILDSIDPIARQAEKAAEDAATMLDTLKTWRGKNPHVEETEEVAEEASAEKAVEETDGNMWAKVRKALPSLPSPASDQYKP